MKYLLTTVATLGVVFALAMLWSKGEDKKDSSLKTIAIVGFIAFLILAYVLTGGSSDD